LPSARKKHSAKYLTLGKDLFSGSERARFGSKIGLVGAKPDPLMIMVLEIIFLVQNSSR
jgi:hypothetical protein